MRRKRPAKRRSYTVRRREVIFSKGPIHLVDCNVSMPSGKILSRQILEHPGSVVIIPKSAQNRYILIRQFRFAARGWLWEFPAGGVEPGESLRHAAARELVEETGYRPSRLTKLFRVFPSPGISSEVMYLFLAEGLSAAFAQGDEDEAIKVRQFSSNEIRCMIASGRIADAKTIAGFLYLQHFRKRS